MPEWESGTNLGSCAGFRVDEIVGAQTPLQEQNLDAAWEQLPPPPPSSPLFGPPSSSGVMPEAGGRWIWSFHGGSDEGGGGDVNNFMTTWRIRFPDGGMETGMMSPPWNKILLAFDQVALLLRWQKQYGERHEKEDDTQFRLQECWPPFIGLWHYFWLSRSSSPGPSCRSRRAQPALSPSLSFSDEWARCVSFVFPEPPSSGRARLRVAFPLRKVFPAFISRRPSPLESSKPQFPPRIELPPQTLGQSRRFDSELAPLSLLRGGKKAAEPLFPLSLALLSLRRSLLALVLANSGEDPAKRRRLRRQRRRGRFQPLDRNPTTEIEPDSSQTECIENGPFEGNQDQVYEEEPPQYFEEGNFLAVIALTKRIRNRQRHPLLSRPWDLASISRPSLRFFLASGRTAPHLPIVNAVNIFSPTMHAPMRPRRPWPLQGTRRAHGSLTPRPRVPELVAGSSCRRPSSPETDQWRGCVSPLTVHASGSADPRLAVASPPRAAGQKRRRRCPSVRRATFAPPRAPFSFPALSPRLAHACLPPAARLRRADAAHDANTAAAETLCPSLHPVLPEHPPPPLSLLLKPPNSSLPQHAGKSSPELAEPPPSLLSWAALSARTSFPITHCHSPSHSPPSSATAAAGAARRRSPSFPPPPAHVHSSLRSSSGRTEGTNSSAVPRWCSPTTSPTLSDPDVAAATVNRGEPLSIFPHFPGPVSPPFGRRKHASEPRDLDSGLADGVYELVPAAEEIAQESEVNVVHVDPSPEQEYRFEPEGKPRSIT
ncbi:hypothetical protein HU200_053089 [Digitaria exilis]|uniref:Uncharacterized protein n=1 Tax=Digitaria exilis TaxID=1010633 RepID=A0A835AQ52_9POAL|nr:hypothetical protein HU200_053089 [Digitaria exilis]